MGKKIISGTDALHKLLAGVNLIANPVKASLGPNGKNCIYERVGTNQPVSSRDGVTICEQIQASDPFENIAVETIKGVAREAVDQSGDGTTTATLLAQAIFAEGVKSITVGSNPVALKRGIEKATSAVVQTLKDMARPVSGDMVRQVATISANNDEFLGGLIASAMDKAGEDGVVTVEISRTPESSLVITDGLQIGTGMILPDFVTNRERNECVLEDVAILLWEKKLVTLKDASKVLKGLAEAGKSLLVIAEDVTDEALAFLVLAHVQNKLKCCAVKTPGGAENLHDIAALTNATVITELSGVKLSTLSPTHLGTAKRVVVRPGSTTIISVDSENIALTRRLNELRVQVAEAIDEGQRLRTQNRLARLAGGVAIIRVGAATELEMNERKDRIEDAMHATRCALKEGIVPGGGIALMQAAQKCNVALSGDEQVGVSIIEKACFAPIRTLAENSGQSPDYIIEKIFSVNHPTYGWNARDDTYGDMIDMGVLDPLRVVRVALESAASVAGLMLITHTLVSNDRP